MIYFDNAATSRYKPRSVIIAAKRALKRSANPGRSSHADAIAAAVCVQDTRDEILSFVNGKHHAVVFTKNCTEALNLALLGTARRGGHVITTALEHNSVLRPLFMLKRKGEIDLSVIPPEADGSLDTKKIQEAIKKSTYLLAVTGMSNVTGYAPPLAEIGEIALSRGLLFAVDGAQSLGHAKTDMEEFGVDLLCGAGHKGLHGAPGTGFLVFNKKLRIEPINYGGTGTESENPYQPELAPESLESGTLNTMGIAALKEGIKWTRRNEGRIKEKTEEISRFLHEKLMETEGVRTYSVNGSPIVSFNISGKDNAAAADALGEEFKIGVRFGLHCAPLIHKAMGTDKTGLIRASIGYGNDMKEAAALVKAVRRIAARRE